MDIVGAMEKDAGVRLSELKVDGGASRNGFWSSLDEVKKQWKAERTFNPSGADTAPLKAGWADAINRTINR